MYLKKKKTSHDHLNRCKKGLRQSIEIHPILYGLQHFFKFHVIFFFISLDTFLTILTIFISQKDPTCFPLLEDIKWVWCKIHFLPYNISQYGFSPLFKLPYVKENYWKETVCANTDWLELQWCGKVEMLQVQCQLITLSWDSFCLPE